MVVDAPFPGAVGGHTSAAPGRKGRSLVDPAFVVGGFGLSVDASHARMRREIEHLWATCSALTAACQETSGLRAPLWDFTSVAESPE